MRTAPTSTGRGLIWLVSVFLFSGFALPAGLRPSMPGADRQIPAAQDAVQINVELVVLYVTALNRRHLPVGGLGRADFRIYEDGVRQEIETFSHEDPPVTVGLVIDNSGSMRTKRTEVIAAAMAFARSSNPKDQLFLVNFNEHVTFGLPADRPFAGDLAQMEMALSTIGALGKTALYDAVAAALEHAKKGQTNKQALIVISDGADNASRYNAARVVALAKHSEAIIYTIGIFEADDPDRDPGSLRQLAKATGGESFLPDSERQATAICEGIARDIRSQYTISYMPTNTKRDGKYRAIQVRAAAPGGEHVYVRTRIGYYAPTKP